MIKLAPLEVAILAGFASLGVATGICGSTSPHAATIGPTDAGTDADAGAPLSTDAGPTPTLTLHVEVDAGLPPIDVRLYELVFAPGKGCTQEVLELVNSAQVSIFMAAYNFSNAEITAALIAAKKRGVDVRVMLDRRDNATNKHSGLHALVDAGIEVSLDGNHPIAHQKTTVVDGVSTELGSFNYSEHANHNSENCLVIRDHVIAIKFTENWFFHRAHSAKVSP